MIEVAAAVIKRDGKILLASRPENKPPAGWEFPGGKLEAGETPADAAKRELMEELALAVAPQKVIYTLERGNLILYFVECTIDGGSEPQTMEGQSVRWQEISEKLPDGLLENDAEFWHFLISQ